MQPYQPSRTAEYMAFFRALESARPPDERLFHDPFAPQFLRPGLRRAARIAQIPFAARLVDRYTDFRLPGARTSAIARTKLIDDELLFALRSGISQIVILGAGFDCRAYRLSELRRATVFEVDHPATLAIKLTRIRELLPRTPDHVRYVETDFIHQELSDALVKSSFQSGLPAVFLWEGVSQYLTRDAVDAVLRLVATSGRGTRLIFTYVHSGMLDGSLSFRAAKRLLCGYAGLGEPWIFGLYPERVSGFLRERGLELDRDLSAGEYRELCFGAASKGMRGYEFHHVASVNVPPHG